MSPRVATDRSGCCAATVATGVAAVAAWDAEDSSADRARGCGGSGFSRDATGLSTPPRAIDGSNKSVGTLRFGAALVGRWSFVDPAAVFVDASLPRLGTGAGSRKVTSMLIAPTTNAAADGNTQRTTTGRQRSKAPGSSTRDGVEAGADGRGAGDWGRPLSDANSSSASTVLGVGGGIGAWLRDET
jgi:hypothetical protein